jgi:hypothetical protein
LGGGGGLDSTNIVSTGEWQSWTSSSEDVDRKHFEAPNSDGEYGVSTSTEANVVSRRTYVCSREETYKFHDGGDVDVEAKKAAWRV